ncbi:GGDEF domain-containing protein [Marinomonas sp. THO17]|uniref:GGDEF domain-containing protein n=1 Tax=Marinomonas sp. THO17 TaxID=3149048 RepID=UPI00336BCE66
MLSERFGSLFVPCCILLLSVYASLYIGILPPAWIGILPLMPLILAAIAILLAWHFNKGRVFILVLLLLIPKLYGGSEQTESITAYLVVSCFSVALLAFVKERGFFNKFAVNRLLFVAMLVTWCYAIERHWVSFSFLDNAVWQFPFTWSDFLLWAGLVVSILLMAAAWWRSNDAFHACGLVSVISLIIISRFSISDGQYDTMLSAQCLLWIWFLLMESYRMAYLDDMTRLPGRRALNEELVGLSKYYAIAMVDVDHFKKFNDTYGHDMGDKVLKIVAEQLKAFSSPGRAFRYGGEEFTLVFRHGELKEVEKVLERVRSSIEKAIVEVFDPKAKKDKGVNVTASIGVAFAASGEDSESVIKRADEALYQSKKKGRNRVSKSLPAKSVSKS